jgi:hypothetical protein
MTLRFAFASGKAGRAALLHPSSICIGNFVFKHVAGKIAVPWSCKN